LDFDTFIDMDAQFRSKQRVLAVDFAMLKGMQNFQDGVGVEYNTAAQKLTMHSRAL
jgi:hypothetical protein